MKVVINNVKKRTKPVVLRGGSWNNFASYARAARRDLDGPGDRYNFLGFRLASLIRGRKI